METLCYLIRGVEAFGGMLGGIFCEGDLATLRWISCWGHSQKQPNQIGLSPMQRSFQCGERVLAHSSRCPTCHCLFEGREDLRHSTECEFVFGDKFTESHWLATLALDKLICNGELHLVLLNVTYYVVSTYNVTTTYLAHSSTNQNKFELLAHHFVLKVCLLNISYYYILCYYYS